MARNVISADELKSGDIFEEGEALRMRISKVYRIRREQAWCGRLRPNTKMPSQRASLPHMRTRVRTCGRSRRYSRRHDCESAPGHLYFRTP